MLFDEPADSPADFVLLGAGGLFCQGARIFLWELSRVEAEHAGEPVFSKLACGGPAIGGRQAGGIFAELAEEEPDIERGSKVLGSQRAALSPKIGFFEDGADRGPSNSRVDQFAAAEALGIGQHDLYKILSFLRGHLLMLHRFQVELDGSQGGFQLMRHAGNEIALQAVQPGLLAPEYKNQEHPSQNNDHQKTNKLKLINALDRRLLSRIGNCDEVESAISNYELAYRMQSTVPELVDFSGESEKIQDLYGFNSSFEPTKVYARQCLLARRLVERGVRFVELTCPKVAADRWDQHGGLEVGHKRNALAIDQPIAALLKDLKSRGLLDETLVIWAGEFGRTPFPQGRDGRDHNPFGFSIWLAGGGIKGGTIHGETDEYGYRAIKDIVTIHDLHATILHLLGIDHTRQTYRFSGRDIRLTDVYGKIITPTLS